MGEKERSARYYLKHKDKIYARAKIKRAKLGKAVVTLKAKKCWLKRKYNLSLADFDSLLEKQNNLCAMCFQPFTDTYKFSKCVDHCHDTNKVRGIIHIQCNSILGNAFDDKEILNGAIKYLNTFKHVDTGLEKS